MQYNVREHAEDEDEEKRAWTGEVYLVCAGWRYQESEQGVVSVSKRERCDKCDPSRRIHTQETF